MWSCLTAEQVAAQAQCAFQHCSSFPSSAQGSVCNRLHPAAQVSDVLSDTNFTLWLAALAKRLQSFEWDSGATSVATLCAILALPSHLQRDIFAQMLPDEVDGIDASHSSRLEELMDRLPHALHSTVLSSQVTVEGRLDIELPEHNPLPLAAMHSTKLHLASPGLVTVDNSDLRRIRGALHGHVCRHNCIPQSSQTPSFLRCQNARPWRDEAVSSSCWAAPRVPEGRNMTDSLAQASESALKISRHSRSSRSS